MAVLARRWTALTADEAPVNSPLEFLTFCGALVLGARGAAGLMDRSEVLDELRRLARDPRWRTREAVAMALQRLLAVDFTATAAALRGWVGAGELLELRCSCTT